MCANSLRDLSRAGLVAPAQNHDANAYLLLTNFRKLRRLRRQSPNLGVTPETCA